MPATEKPAQKPEKPVQRTRKPRTVRPNPAPDSFAARVRATVARLHLSEAQAATYFGVPVFTLRKWISGEREPGAAVVRLLDVLGIVEALAPDIHEALLPSESGHVEKSGI